MTKPVVVYIISEIDKSYAFEWIVSSWDWEKWDLQVILLNNQESQFEEFLVIKQVPFYRIGFGGFKTLTAIYKVYIIIKNADPSAVHCHLFTANLVGLISCSIAGVNKRIYTRHHSSYNWEYNRKGIILDVLFNRISTDVVAISKNVQRHLIQKEKVKPEKVHLIHHGFELGQFAEVDSARVEKLSEKYIPSGRQPIIGVVARWIEWKGIQYVIPAFAELLKSYPTAFLILANAHGPFQSELEHQLNMLLPADSYCRIRFEYDQFALYRMFDIYVHVPVNQNIEAYGQTYVEALASSIPSVFTLSGVASEIVKDEKNALIVPYRNSEQIYNAIIRLLEDQQLNHDLKGMGKEDIKTFTVEKMMGKLNALYSTTT